jgi:hypothetical protein
MTETLTDEQLRELSHANFDPTLRNVATELLALRAERAKPTQSDYELAREIVRGSCGGDDECGIIDSLSCGCFQQIMRAFASIRAEGNAERAKLEGALRPFIKRQAELANELDALLLAQPAESGAMTATGELLDGKTVGPPYRAQPGAKP